MGIGQLAWIPEWAKNKLEELTSRVSKNETDISTINSDLENINQNTRLFEGRFNGEKLDTELLASDIISQYRFLVLHQDYNSKVINYMIPTCLLWLEQTFLLYGANGTVEWCHLTTGDETMKAYCSTNASANLYFELYGIGKNNYLVQSL